MSGKPLLLPEVFSGESQSWTEWAEHFENVATVNKWDSDEDKLKWLKVRLTGKARTVFQKLPADVRNKYACKKAVVRGRTSHQGETYRDEDCASYGDALRVLVDKAYSDLEEKARERLALTQFLAHIGNPQVAFGVRQKRPETVEAAVVATIELESYLNSCSSRVQGGATAVASAATANSTEPILEATE
eukprot:Em0004g1712a